MQCSCIHGLTFNVSDFGGYPNDSIDDTNATQTAIITALMNGSNNIVVFQAGTYDFTSSVYIYNGINLTVTGQGQEITTLLGHSPTTVFMVLNSQGITITMLAIDYDPLPFTAGYVMSAKATYLELRVVSPHRADIGRTVETILRYDPVLMRPAIGARAYEIYQSPPPNINTSFGTNGTLRIPLANPSSFAVGDAIIVRYGFAFHAFFGQNVPDFTLKSINIYTAWYMGVFTLRAPRLNIIDYHVKRINGRWMSTIVDCMHFADSRDYINVFDTSCEGQGDDGLNVQAFYFQVIQKVNASALIIQQYNWQEALNIGVGTRVEFATGQKPFNGYTSAIVASLVDYNATSKFFTFTSAVNASVGDWVCVADTPVLTIRNLTVANNRARGVLLQTRNIHMTQSLFNRTSGPAVLMNPSLYWHEGPGAINVTLDYNMYISCNEGVTREKGMIALAPDPVQFGPVMSRIQIKSSTFIHGTYSGKMIQCTNGDNVSISDNYMMSSNATIPVLICNSKNIFASNNCIDNNQSTLGQFYSYDSTNPCLNNLSSSISLPRSAFNSSFFPPVIATNSGVELNVVQTSPVAASITSFPTATTASVTGVTNITTTALSSFVSFTAVATSGMTHSTAPYTSGVTNSTAPFTSDTTSTISTTAGNSGNSTTLTASNNRNGIRSAADRIAYRVHLHVTMVSFIITLSKYR